MTRTKLNVKIILVSKATNLCFEYASVYMSVGADIIARTGFISANGKIPISYAHTP